MSEGKKEQVRQNSQKAALPKEICIPDDFEGVVQINIQSQKETETETESITQSQTQNTAVAVNQLQNQMEAVQVQVQQMQSQEQAWFAQTSAQLQGLQSQLQLLFMAVLGSPAGADAGARQQMLREIVTALRENPK